VAVDDDQPDGLVAALRRQGFDATRVATLAVVPAPAGRPDLRASAARQLVDRIVYLPAYPELGRRALDRLSRAVAAHRRQVPDRAQAAVRPITSESRPY
jgi:hypothetical protein